jgi:OmpA-OmpF porin, OOP family
MKNVFLCALAACTAASVVPATAAQDAGWFASVGGARTSMVNNKFLDPDQARLDPFQPSNHTDRTDRAFDGRVGYRWAMTDTLALGVEAGYADLGKAKAVEHGNLRLSGIGYYASYDSLREQKSKAALIGANARWHIAQRWSLAGRVGMARYKTTFSETFESSIVGVPQPTTHGSTSHRSTDYFAGVSLGFDIVTNLTLSLNADVYRPETYTSSYPDGYEHRDYENKRLIATGISLEYRF